MSRVQHDSRPSRHLVRRSQRVPAGRTGASRAGAGARSRRDKERSAHLPLGRRATRDGRLCSGMFVDGPSAIAVNRCSRVSATRRVDGATTSLRVLPDSRADERWRAALARPSSAGLDRPAAARAAKGRAARYVRQNRAHDALVRPRRRLASIQPCGSSSARTTRSSCRTTARRPRSTPRAFTARGCSRPRSSSRSRAARRDRARPVRILDADEDVHSAIERLLGPLGRKIHAGRSRNDQVAAALPALRRRRVRRGARGDRRARARRRSRSPRRRRRR